MLGAAQPDLCLKPERQGDPHYRYRMPPIDTSCDNRSKQRKTHLHNIGDVARAIFRPEAWLVKYIALRLSTDSGACTAAGEDAYLTGHHPEAALQALVFDFIAEYVLCSKCRSPETLLHVEGKKRHKVCRLQCHACGKDSKASGQSDKMLNLFAAHPMPPELCPMMRGNLIRGERVDDVVKALCTPFRDAACNDRRPAESSAEPPIEIEPPAEHRAEPRAELPPDSRDSSVQHTLHT